MNVELLTAHDLQGINVRLESLENSISKIVANVESKGDKEYLTRKDVAKFLNITLPTLNDWTNKGILTAYKLGGRVYYKHCDIVAQMVQKGGKYAN